MNLLEKSNSLNRNKHLCKFSDLEKIAQNFIQAFREIKSFANLSTNIKTNNICENKSKNNKDMLISFLESEILDLSLEKQQRKKNLDLLNLKINSVNEKLLESEVLIHQININIKYLLHQK